MITLTVQSIASKRRGRCFKVRPDSMMQTCGLCTRGEIAPWVGAPCPHCSAIVVSVEATEPQDAIELGRFMVQQVQRWTEAQAGETPEARGNAAAVRAHDRLLQLTRSFNAAPR